MDKKTIKIRTIAEIELTDVHFIVRCQSKRDACDVCHEHMKMGDERWAGYSRAFERDYALCADCWLGGRYESHIMGLLNEKLQAALFPK
jgi:hypothetical protein